MNPQLGRSRRRDRRGVALDIVEQIKDAVAGHEDVVNQGIDTVGDVVDEKTGGQYAAQVDQAQGLLKDQLGTDEEAK